jgi:hypothetical protein
LPPPFLYLEVGMKNIRDVIADLPCLSNAEINELRNEIIRYVFTGCTPLTLQVELDDALLKAFELGKKSAK